MRSCAVVPLRAIISAHVCFQYSVCTALDFRSISFLQPDEFLNSFSLTGPKFCMCRAVSLLASLTLVFTAVKARQGPARQKSYSRLRGRSRAASCPHQTAPVVVLVKQRPGLRELMGWVRNEVSLRPVDSTQGSGDILPLRFLLLLLHWRQVGCKMIVIYSGFLYVLVTRTLSPSGLFSAR